MDSNCQLGSRREGAAPGRRISAMMAVLLACAATSAVGCGASSPVSRDRALARRLSNDSTRDEAVAEIAGSGTNRVPLLLSWGRTPPARLDVCGLYVGLAAAFGRMRTKEAIPFLVKNISIRRPCYADFSPWFKAPEAIEATFPAVAALVRIGPEASRAVIRAWQEPMLPWDRLAALFVVSHVQGVPEAQTFLRTALGEASQERAWAEYGLRLP